MLHTVVCAIRGRASEEGEAEAVPADPFLNILLGGGLHFGKDGCQPSAGTYAIRHK